VVVRKNGDTTKKLKKIQNRGLLYLIPFHKNEGDSIPWKPSTMEEGDSDPMCVSNPLPQK
jgi:hypothetical protein